MRVLILTPSTYPDLTGNAVTAERLRSGLVSQGAAAETARAVRGDLNPAFSGARPDIIHALHAGKSGPAAMTLSESLQIPFAVTITGTDLNVDLVEKGSTAVATVLEKAAAVIVYSGETRDRLLAARLVLAGKTRVINPSVSFPDLPEDLSSGTAGPNFLLPTGIRPVKDPSFAVAPLGRLQAEFPTLTLTVAGPRLDEDEWARFAALTKGRPWIRYLTVPHNEMPSLYREADVILNTSRSEGLSNAVLEGMCFGRALLVSDCEGNRSAVSDGVEGLIYRTGDGEDFLHKARRLAADAELRKELGRRGRERVRREYVVEAEITAHLNLYREILSK